MKKKRWFIMAFTSSVMPLCAQTFNHDATKMNQFTVMETGAGALIPTTYYYTFHSGYQSWAPFSSKEMWRGMLMLELPKEEEDADSVRANLQKRAKVEAVNMVDRNAVTNWTWLAQRDKVNAKLSEFSNNIENICLYGGTPAERKSWLEIYNQVTCGINVVNKSYLSNSRRLKSYLSLYEDLQRFNNQLCARLLSLKNTHVISFGGDFSSHSDKRKICVDSYQRWKVSLFSGGGGAH